MKLFWELEIGLDPICGPVPHVRSQLSELMEFRGKKRGSFRVSVQGAKSLGNHFTPPNSEIICGQNVGTKVVCGIIFFFEKKAMLKI